MVQQGLAAAGAIRPHVQPFTSYSPLNFFGLILCLMVGTAALPHVLMRYFTTPSVREARTSGGLDAAVHLHPLLHGAGLCRLREARSVQGRHRPDPHQPPTWVYSYGKVGLVKVCGVDATTLEAIRAACAKAVNFSGDMATFTHQLRFADLRIDNDAIVISTPEIAGLPYVVAGLVAAGGLAAALSTADGLLLAIANALSHDVYYKMVNPNAPTERRLVIARVLLVLVALIAAYVASHRPADIVAMVAWAFSLAAGGLFPALVLGSGGSGRARPAQSPAWPSASV
jgi:cation/acetate symporter